MPSFRSQGGDRQPAKESREVGGEPGQGCISRGNDHLL